MQHETAEIKKSIKKYKTINGVEKKSISYNINLGAKSNFNTGDTVAVILLSDFENIVNINADEIQNLKKIVADKNETISANNESIDKLNAELQNKFNLINDLTAKNKSLKKNVFDLESNISINNEKIAELESELTVADATIKKLNDEINKLNELLSNSKQYIINQNETIFDFEKKIAVYDAINISDLENKAKDLEKADKIIIQLQNEKIEYIQLTAYKDKLIDALKNKSFFDILLKKDVTDNISTPDLYFIDVSGNPIKKNNDDIEVDATIDDDEKSGDDTLTLI